MMNVLSLLRISFVTIAITVGGHTGLATNSCGAAGSCSAPIQNAYGMETCLTEEFAGSDDKVVLPRDDNYFKETYTWGGIQYPAAVVYVENEDEAMKAMVCAIDNGFAISPRGRGHSYQGLSTMSGYVVIDMKRTCKPDDMVIDKSDTGNHILPGSKYVGTIKAFSGCTNAIMLATGHKHFLEENGMVLIGTCPSVGITGFTLGGGSGDLTQYTGYAIDLLKEVEMLVYDGKKVKKVVASEKENTDLFWATRGGGGTNGVITTLTYKVVKSPSKKFTVMNVIYDFHGDEQKLRKYSKRFQDFLYHNEDSIKFGGNGQVDANGAALELMYLGSAKDGVRDLEMAGLLDDDLLADVNTLYMKNYDVRCDGTTACVANGIPEKGAPLIAEFNTYAEAVARKVLVTPQLESWFDTQSTGNMCDDLGIDADEYCFVSSDPSAFIHTLLLPSAHNTKVVVHAIMEAAGDPNSFLQEADMFTAIEGLLDRTGSGQSLEEATDAVVRPLITSNVGGLLFPELDIDTLVDISKIGLKYNHFQHGAPLQISSTETALPWRDAAIMTDNYGTPLSSKNATARDLIVKRIAKEDASKVQGYYAYVNPIGTTDWKKFYFGENYERLSQIKGKYDPHDVFGKPLTVDIPYNLDDKSSTPKNPCSMKKICPSPTKIKADKMTKNLFPDIFRQNKVRCGDLANVLAADDYDCMLHKEMFVVRCCRE